MLLNTQCMQEPNARHIKIINDFEHILEYEKKIF